MIPTISFEVANHFVTPMPDTLLPLRELVPELLDQIRTRVHDQGTDRYGRRWSRYVVGRGPQLYWAKPDMPQPEKNRLAVSSDGFAAYLNWSAYREAVGMAVPAIKSMKMSGELRASLRDTYTSARTGAIEYATTARRSIYGPGEGTNADLARRLFERERTLPLALSKAELQALEKRMAEVAMHRIVDTSGSNASPGASPFKGRRLF